MKLMDARGLVEEVCSHCLLQAACWVIVASIEKSITRCLHACMKCDARWRAFDIVPFSRVNTIELVEVLYRVQVSVIVERCNPFSTGFCSTQIDR